MVPGRPIVDTPSFAKSLAPVKEPSPPITTKESIP